MTCQIQRLEFIQNNLFWIKIMKTKKLTPLQAAPVQRETVTNASTADANAIAPARAGGGRGIPMGAPFAGDDAE
ncbi:hypothetical protein BJP34_20685 [Moorena producens PAL-8-15-08-1]|uniref:Anacyclamide/piricyclamide family prenylated cyclic peptide n=2 Tax=Coleofasciculaceae TaxID=1892251 RepID=A0A1D8TVP2_9CYAN|nr:hypothetical protein BJP34_20685 [Moorena producens PAL-8-15-08-1]